MKIPQKQKMKSSYVKSTLDFVFWFFLFFFLIVKWISVCGFNSIARTLNFVIFIITDSPYVIINLLSRFIFGYFYFKIITNPILDYTSIFLEGLNRFNIEKIFLLVVSGVSAYIGLKLYN